MKILQFAFGKDARHPFLPHNFPTNCVVYTGTHDNDTTRGWYASAPEKERHFARAYLGCDGSDFAWDLIRAGWPRWPTPSSRRCRTSWTWVPRRA